MDIEDVKASYYDLMRMAGKLIISRESQPFQQSLDDKERLCSAMVLAGVCLSGYHIGKIRKEIILWRE